MLHCILKEPFFILGPSTEAADTDISLHLLVSRRASNNKRWKQNRAVFHGEARAFSCGRARARQQNNAVGLGRLISNNIWARL